MSRTASSLCQNRYPEPVVMIPLRHPGRGSRRCFFFFFFFFGLDGAEGEAGGREVAVDEDGVVVVEAADGVAGGGAPVGGVFGP
jgi:hypothetical protein